MSTELHEETTKLYISAARQRQSDAIDPDIQVGAVSWQGVMTVSMLKAGLGVLFNLSWQGFLHP